MHVVTHVLSGWCAANLFRLSPRERLCCIAAASLADLDGLGILVSQDAYWNYHHKLTHNLPFGVVVTVLLALVSQRRLLAGCIYLALFHLHLLMDYFGSGPGWPIYYLWPFSSLAIDNTHASWEFYSWQNISIGVALIVLTFWIAVSLGRTPLELPMPSLDRQLVQWLRNRLPKRLRVVRANESAAKAEGVTAAGQIRSTRDERVKIFEEFGKVPFHDDYDYKRLRHRGPR